MLIVRQLRSISHYSKTIHNDVLVKDEEIKYALRIQPKDLSLPRGLFKFEGPFLQ